MQNSKLTECLSLAFATPLRSRPLWHFMLYDSTMNLGFQGPQKETLQPQTWAWSVVHLPPLCLQFGRCRFGAFCAEAAEALSDSPFACWTCLERCGRVALRHCGLMIASQTARLLHSALPTQKNAQRSASMRRTRGIQWRTKLLMVSRSACSNSTWEGIAPSSASPFQNGSRSIA